MFETLLAKPSDGRARTAPLVVAGHALVLAALTAGSLWSAAEPSGEPVVPLVFSVGHPPPPRAGDPDSSVGAVKASGIRAPTVLSPVATLESVADQPEPSGTQPTEDAGTESAVGLPEDGGDSSGVPGGRGIQEGSGDPRADPGDPIPVGGDVVAPALVRRIEPDYPERARKIRLEGVVILQATIAESGFVENVRVLKSAAPLLDAAALDAVDQWRYEPATLNGRRVRVFLTVTVQFKVH